MKRKVFIPHSIAFILLESFFISLSILSIIIFILGLNGNFKIETYTIPLMIIAIIFLTFNSIRFLYASLIFLNKKSLFKPNDMLPKYERIQFKCIINYKDIKKVCIIASEKNSKNKKITYKWISSNITKKFLEFTLNDDKIERIWINYYTKKQIIKLLNILIANIEKHENPNKFNIDKIMEDWYSYGVKNNKEPKN